jgi:tRNA (adenine22-N1)-methyltransferase
VRLSHRLSKLHTFYQGESAIWDIGCDHGQLGRSFLADPRVKEINFVDPSAAVIAVLTEELKDAYITIKPFLNIFHTKGQEVKLTASSNCIFIAGMGGHEIGDILNHLQQQLGPRDRVIISPHRNTLELRKNLHASVFYLEYETLVFEAGQFYQMLVLSLDSSNPKVSWYGEKIWQEEVSESYRQHQLKTFGRHKDMASLAYLAYLNSLSH